MKIVEPTKSLGGQRHSGVRYDFFGDELRNGRRHEMGGTAHLQSVPDIEIATTSLSRSEAKALTEVREIAESKVRIGSKKNKWSRLRLAKVSAISAIGVPAIFALGASPAAADDLDNSSSVEASVVEQAAADDYGEQIGVHPLAHDPLVELYLPYFERGIITSNMTAEERAAAYIEAVAAESSEVSAPADVPVPVDPPAVDVASVAGPAIAEVPVEAVAVDVAVPAVEVPVEAVSVEAVDVDPVVGTFDISSYIDFPVGPSESLPAVEEVSIDGRTPQELFEVVEEAPVSGEDTSPGLFGITVESEGNITTGDDASVTASRGSSTTFSPDGTIETTERTSVGVTLSHEAGLLDAELSGRASTIDQTTIDPEGNVTRGEGNSFEGSAGVGIDRGPINLGVEAGGSVTNLDLEGTSIDQNGNVVSTTGTSESTTANFGVQAGLETPEGIPVVGGNVNVGADLVGQVQSTETVATNSGQPGQEITTKTENTFLGIQLSTGTAGNVGILGQSGGISAEAEIVNIEATDSVVRRDGAVQSSTNAETITVGPVEVADESTIDVSGPNDVITYVGGITAPGVDIVSNVQQVTNENGTVVEQDDSLTLGGPFIPDVASRTQVSVDPETGAVQTTTTSTRDGILIDSTNVVQTVEQADGTEQVAGSSVVTFLGVPVIETESGTVVEHNEITPENLDEIRGSVFEGGPDDSFELGTISEFGPVTDIAVETSSFGLDPSGIDDSSGRDGFFEDNTIVETSTDPFADFYAYADSFAIDSPSEGFSFEEAIETDLAFNSYSLGSTFELGESFSFIEGSESASSTFDTSGFDGFGSDFDGGISGSPHLSGLDSPDYDYFNFSDSADLYIGGLSSAEYQYFNSSDSAGGFGSSNFGSTNWGLSGLNSPDYDYFNSSDSFSSSSSWF